MTKCTPEQEEAWNKLLIDQKNSLPWDTSNEVEEIKPIVVEKKKDITDLMKRWGK